MTIAHSSHVGWPAVMCLAPAEAAIAAQTTKRSQLTPADVALAHCPPAGKAHPPCVVCSAATRTAIARRGGGGGGASGGRGRGNFLLVAVYLSPPPQKRAFSTPTSGPLSRTLHAGRLAPPAAPAAAARPRSHARRPHTAAHAHAPFALRPLQGQPALALDTRPAQPARATPHARAGRRPARDSPAPQPRARCAQPQT